MGTAAATSELQRGNEAWEQPTVQPAGVTSMNKASTSKISPSPKMNLHCHKLNLNLRHRPRNQSAKGISNSPECLNVPLRSRRSIREVECLLQSKKHVAG